MALIHAIWRSFRALPGWVQIWVAVFLVPINSASIFFILQPMGGWIALLAIGAMLMNLPVMLVERGFSKMMALPHLLPWTILVAILLFVRPVGNEAYGIFLWVLLATDVMSLAFDFPDALQWWRGDRAVAGANTA